MGKKDFYENHEKIEIPICFYIDDNGKKVYDLEAMSEEFERKLGKLDGESNLQIICDVWEVK
tara:strand:+ start:777 stop:962 length:186 start_codon:yes stop_codon:yes gene_type:complete